MASLFCRFPPPSACHTEEHGHPTEVYLLLPLRFPADFFLHLGLILWAVILNFLCVSIPAHTVDAFSLGVGLVKQKGFRYLDISDGKCLICLVLSRRLTMSRPQELATTIPFPGCPIPLLCIYFQLLKDASAPARAS